MGLCWFFFDFALALGAHLAVNDGEFSGALVALILLFASSFNRPEA
ncbi:hypothetical protein [Aureicoccus marinus]|jgi:hypothetical protein|nr:hypothetical protein [Aureicoccus marinus]